MRALAVVAAAVSALPLLVAGARVARAETAGGPHMTAIAVAFGKVWATTSDGAVVRVDPGTPSRHRHVGTVGSSGFSIAAGMGSVWVSGNGGFHRLHPRSGRILRRYYVEGHASVIAVRGRALWILDGRRDESVRIDPRSNRFLARIKPASSPSRLAAGGSGVWARLIQGAEARSWSLWRIDGRRNRLARPVIRLFCHGGAVAVRRRLVWVSDECGRRILRFSVATGNRVGPPLLPGRRAFSIAAHSKDIWVASYDRTVTRIDEPTGAVVATISLPSPGLIAAGPGQGMGRKHRYSRAFPHRSEEEPGRRANRCLGGNGPSQPRNDSLSAAAASSEIHPHVTTSGSHVSVP